MASPSSIDSPPTPTPEPQPRSRPAIPAPPAIWYHIAMPTEPEPIDLQAVLAPQAGLSPAGRQAADFFGDVVRFASQLPEGQLELKPIACRTLVRRKPCPGWMVVERKGAAEGHVIAWDCRQCHANGTIDRWQGTVADLRAMQHALPKQLLRVPISVESFAALRQVGRHDPALGRVAFTAEVAAEGWPLLVFAERDRPRFQARLLIEVLRRGPGRASQPLQEIIGQVGGDPAKDLLKLSAEETEQFLLDMLESSGLPQLPGPAALAGLTSMLSSEFGLDEAESKPARTRKVAKRDQTTLQIKVTLRDVRPPVWRRLLVPSHMPLSKLHDVLQVAMGWYDCHLHLFRIRNECFAPPGDWEPVGHDSTNMVLADLASAKGDRLIYEYDFGDGWTHDILVESVLPEPCEVPRCLAGRRRCPPEDCGGPWGYENLLAALAGEDVEDSARLIEWVGGEFDPAEFDVERTDLAVQRLGKQRRRRQ